MCVLMCLHVSACLLAFLKPGLFMKLDMKLRGQWSARIYWKIWVFLFNRKCSSPCPASLSENHMSTKNLVLELWDWKFCKIETQWSYFWLFYSSYCIFLFFLNFILIGTNKPNFRPFQSKVLVLQPKVMNLVLN